MARALAQTIGYIYIDSGAMYRAATLLALQEDLLHPSSYNQLQTRLSQSTIEFRLNPATQQQETYLNGQNVEARIRTLQVSQNVSPIAALPFVRQQLTALQQRLGQHGGIVMDGRDIGTTVFPNAQLKVFVTARPEVRARRRLLEMEQKGEQADFDSILRNVLERDYIDSHRDISPLRQAPDALLLDNSDLTPAQQLAFLVQAFHQVTANNP